MGYLIMGDLPCVLGIRAYPVEANGRIGCWFAIRVKPRSEFRATDELTRRGFEVFLPSQRVKRRWSDRSRIAEEALFPGYCFCRFELAERLRLLEVPGVIEVVGNGKTPIPVDEAEVSSLQTMVASGVFLTGCPFLRNGQRVRIEDGPLSGVEGLIIRSESGKPRVVVSVTLLQRSVAAEVDRDWIRPVM